MESQWKNDTSAFFQDQAQKINIGNCNIHLKNCIN